VGWWVDGAGGRGREVRKEGRKEGCGGDARLALTLRSNPTVILYTSNRVNAAGFGDFRCSRKDGAVTDCKIRTLIRPMFIAALNLRMVVNKGPLVHESRAAAAAAAAAASFGTYRCIDQWTMDCRPSMRGSRFEWCKFSASAGPKKRQKRHKRQKRGMFAGR
jgi:hypothetical protein